MLIHKMSQAIPNGKPGTGNRLFSLTIFNMCFQLFYGPIIMTGSFQAFPLPLSIQQLLFLIHLVHFLASIFSFITFAAENGIHKCLYFAVLLWYLI